MFFRSDVGAEGGSGNKALWLFFAGGPLIETQPRGKRQRRSGLAEAPRASVSRSLPGFELLEFSQKCRIQKGVGERQKLQSFQLLTRLDRVCHVFACASTSAM